jgi:hypothetical protein
MRGACESPRSTRIQQCARGIRACAFSATTAHIVRDRNRRWHSPHIAQTLSCIFINTVLPTVRQFFQSIERLITQNAKSMKVLAREPFNTFLCSSRPGNSGFLKEGS